MPLEFRTQQEAKWRTARGAFVEIDEVNLIINPR